MGRLTQVTEAPGVSGYGFVTNYTYDALDDLTSVVQNGSRNRNFVYDSLSRLTSASNPESGTVAYTYDANSSLLSKTSPAPDQNGTQTSTISYCYDALNRVTSKAYTMQSCPMSSSAVVATFTYDISSIDGDSNFMNPVGRLIKADQVSYGSVHATTYMDYDPMGRVQHQAQCVSTINCAWGSWWVVTNTYDLAGNLASYTDAFGNTFTQTFDGAGRPTSLASSWVDSAHPSNLINVASGNGYLPTGALAAATLGNGLQEAFGYNNRLQVCRIGLAQVMGPYSNCNQPVVSSGNVEDFAYSRNEGVSDNGNVAAFYGDGVQFFARGYTYDPLNRLYTYQSTSPGETCNLQWTYDAWGNMTNQTVTAGSCPQLALSATAQNQLTNGITSGSTAILYDAAGNMNQDGYGNYYWYDAENRLAQIDGNSFGDCSTATACYLYNALGQRVDKYMGAGTNVTYYIYGSDGEVVSDANAQGSWNETYIRFGGDFVAEYRGTATGFIHKDHLGSTRLVTLYPWVNTTESVYDNMDYLPFGYEIAGGSATTHKFTGKERDAESGLDNFGARYDSSSIGRFMSPDPLYIEARRLLDPQSLNLYSYVRNNPLSLTDSTGLLVDVNCSQVTQEQCQQTVTDLNNRKDAQFQVTRDGQTGQLNVVGDVDASKLSGSEAALYDAITNGESVGTLNVVPNDASFDFEKSNGPGQNTLDRSDLNALNGANGQLSGEIIAHAAVESYVSGSYGYTDATSDRAHDFANNFFSVQYNPRLWTPFRDPATGLVLGASNRFYFAKPNVDVMTRVRTTFVTPIPYVDWSKSTTLPPRNVTGVTIMPAAQ